MPLLEPIHLIFMNIENCWEQNISSAQGAGNWQHFVIAKIEEKSGGLTAVKAFLAATRDQKGLLKEFSWAQALNWQRIFIINPGNISSLFGTQQRMDETTSSA